jgi:type II secretion system protein I
MMTAQRLRRINNKGFTILEILVTVVILAVAVTALASMQVSNVKTTGFSKNATIATAVAQMQLEQLKNSNFDTIVTNTAGVTVQGMKVTWDVQSFDTGVNAAPNRYKEVEVKVEWVIGREQGQDKKAEIKCYTVITEP